MATNTRSLCYRIFFLLPSNEDILLKTNKKSADKKGKKEFFDFIVHFLPFVFILEEN